MVGRRQRCGIPSEVNWRLSSWRLRTDWTQTSHPPVPRSTPSGPSCCRPGPRAPSPILELKAGLFPGFNQDQDLRFKNDTNQCAKKKKNHISIIQTDPVIVTWFFNCPPKKKQNYLNHVDETFVGFCTKRTCFYTCREQTVSAESLCSASL